VAAEEGLTLDQAAALIRQVEEAAASRAADALRGALPTAIGVVTNDRRLPSELPRILASHTLLHSAEGDLYEQAIIEGASRLGLHAITAPGKSVIPHCAAVLGTTAEVLIATLNVAGRAAGPPWRTDHREAAAAALAARIASRR
jgi:hypothetical protein